MLSNFLTQKIIEHLDFTPNNEQKALIEALSDFLFSKLNDEVFLLKGYAGTGKTSIASALIKTMNDFEQPTLLLAPTGRAAKVMSVYSGHPAYTIHKKIYRQKSVTDFSFSLSFNPHKHTLFIVDEASMINNDGFGDSAFGTGKLLDDLISYVYQGEGCRLLMMGDDAQLPPISQKDSPALKARNLELYSLKVKEFTLHTVARQDSESGILYNATIIRNRIQNNAPIEKPKFKIDGFQDVKCISGAELIESLNNSYKNKGITSCSVIVRSNKQAAIYNNGIRNHVLQREDEIGSGDLIIITKNNYYWGKDYDGFDFIANGNIAEVVRIIKHHDIYGLHYADLILRFLDYDHELEARVLLDALHTDTPQAMEELNQKAFNTIMEDYQDIPNKKDRMKEMRKNEYYNALQVKFAYAVTCHKAQGGQWDSVYIDQGMLSIKPTEDYYHWLYTALTRATKHLYLVNFPKDCF